MTVPSIGSRHGLPQAHSELGGRPLTPYELCPFGFHGLSLVLGVFGYFIGLDSIQTLKAFNKTHGRNGKLTSLQYVL